MHMNRKGFTLVELLAAITILGLLMSVAIASVSWILDSSEENFYETLEKNILLTAENYCAENRGALPSVEGQERRVYLKTLVDSNYLGKNDVVDYGKAACNINTSYVSILKKKNGGYSYKLRLYCPARNIDTVGDAMKNTTLNISSSGINLSTKTASVSFSSNKELASYQYSVYRDNMIVYNSPSITLSGKSDTKTIDLSSFDGTLKVVVTVYAATGKSKTITIN